MLSGYFLDISLGSDKLFEVESALSSVFGTIAHVFWVLKKIVRFHPILLDLQLSSSWIKGYAAARYCR
jgi:hypothetical protein